MQNDKKKQEFSLIEFNPKNNEDCIKKAWRATHKKNDKIKQSLV